MADGQACLTKEAILAAEDVRVERMDVPEWGGFVYVRTLSCVQREGLDDWQLARREAKESDVTGWGRRLVALAMCDSEGKRTFEGTPLEEAAGILAAKAAAVVGRITEKAMDVNDMGPDAEELAEGNSEAAEPASSSSDSPGS